MARVGVARRRRSAGHEEGTCTCGFLPLTQLMHLQLRAVEKTGLERRLAKLERQLQVMLGVDRQPTHD
jgi:hypothetical protein